MENFATARRFADGALDVQVYSVDEVSMPNVSQESEQCRAPFDGESTVHDKTCGETSDKLCRLDNRSSRLAPQERESRKSRRLRASHRSAYKPHYTRKDNRGVIIPVMRDGRRIGTASVAQAEFSAVGIGPGCHIPGTGVEKVLRKEEVIATLRQAPNGGYSDARRLLLRWSSIAGATVTECGNAAVMVNGKLVDVVNAYRLSNLPADWREQLDNVDWCTLDSVRPGNERVTTIGRKPKSTSGVKPDKAKPPNRFQLIIASIAKKTGLKTSQVEERIIGLLASVGPKMAQSALEQVCKSAGIDIPDWIQ